MAKKNLNNDYVKETIIFLLRIALGWLFFYAGVEKLMNPEWTASGFLLNAKTFHDLYASFASAGNIGWVNSIVPWGEISIGLGLIFGTFTRLASYFAILLLALFYFPGLDFPHVKNGFIVDEKIIYILVFAALIYVRAGTIWGLDYFINKKVQNWFV